jgi:hypothetical protein
MQDAVKMQRLDFAKVSKEPPQTYRRATSGTELGDLKRLRRKMSEARVVLTGQGAWEPVAYQSAPYDESYLQAMSTLENEES